MRAKDVRLKNGFARVIVAICWWIFQITDVELAPYRIYRQSLHNMYSRYYQQKQMKIFTESMQDN
jgi:hypothetical protein